MGLGLAPHDPPAAGLAPTAPVAPQPPPQPPRGERPGRGGAAWACPSRCKAGRGGAAGVPLSARSMYCDAPSSPFPSAVACSPAASQGRLTAAGQHAAVISGPPRQREQPASDLVADEVDDEPP
ncbi:hypothetical protein PVAP13_3KG497601 [Panicum virgatum]|uniref:Uncharacterized protein n=1 Tax=Panicum virgatum TaxID=38727 RepID=A0A8T0VBL6_PANVG|nr:hypothetical protein PVAP13_3KG497601 [Panicum virgatum]